MRAGWSWPEVAEALGVTRQAVHKKHAKRLIAAGVELRTLMFQRFTKGAREAVNEASLIARDLGASSVEAEHIRERLAHGGEVRRAAAVVASWARYAEA